MENLNVTYFNNFKSITSQWNELFLLQSRTSFCSLSWHKLVLKLLSTKFLTSKIFKISYFEVTLGAQQALGFYYIKIVNKKQTLVFGPITGPSDYFDFVCNDAVDAAFLKEVILKIVEHTQVTNVNFEHIQKNTVLFEACMLFNNFAINALKCVAITLDQSYEQHLKSMSKNARQNLRTANNRLIKSELPYEISFLSPENKDQINFKALKSLYKQRNAHKTQHVTLKSKLYKAVDNFFQTETDMFDLEEIKETDFVLGILKIDDKIAAYFFGLLNKTTIEINRVAINDAFRYYSPGMILLDAFIKKGFELGIKIIDLTVGDEKYKYDLGGQTHEIVSMTGKI